MSEYSDKVDDGTADGESARTEGHDSDYASSCAAPVEH